MEVAQRNGVCLLLRVANRVQKAAWKREDISETLLPLISTVQHLFCMACNCC